MKSTSIKKEADTKRINVPVPTFLLNRLDDEAVKYGMSRNQMLTIVLRDYFKSIDGQDMIKQANDFISKAVTIKDNVDMYEPTVQGQQVLDMWKETLDPRNN